MRVRSFSRIRDAWKRAVSFPALSQRGLLSRRADRLLVRGRRPSGNGFQFQGTERQPLVGRKGWVGAR